MASHSSRWWWIFGPLFLLLIVILSLYLNVQKRFFSKSLLSNLGRTSILVLGVGGKGHDGADLTDTIILTSLSPAQKSVDLISLPRDLWIPEIRAKINSAYYWGETEPSLGGGFSLSKETVSRITGQEINYVVLIDFAGFKEIVDALGGIDVEVANTFTDTKYPIAGKENDLCGGKDRTYACRYETVHFEKGLTHLDGTTALKFVRSRNGDHEENTDFAREARQQKVITAIKNEALSFHSWANPKTDLKLYQAIRNSIKTDIPEGVLGSLALSLFASRSNIQTHNFPQELLLNPPISSLYDRQYVLIPKMGNGKWAEIQTWLKNTW